MFGLSWHYHFVHGISQFLWFQYNERKYFFLPDQDLSQRNCLKERRKPSGSHFTATWSISQFCIQGN